MSQMRLVANLSTTDFEDAYGGTIYTIPSGESAVVPLEAANLWFGDATIRNDGNRRRRDEEYNRLRIRYGGFDDDTAFEANRPFVNVTSLDGKTNFDTVLDDPKGRNVHQAERTVAQDDSLRALIEAQKAQIEELRGMIQQKIRSEAALSEDTLADDMPPVSGAPGRAARTRSARKKASAPKPDLSIDDLIDAPDLLDQQVEAVGMESLPVDKPV